MSFALMPAQAAARPAAHPGFRGELIPASKPPAPSAAVGPLEMLCFRAHGQEYGLPLLCIQEIRRYQAATPLPGQAASVLGVLDLRGQVIALYDLRQLLNLPAAGDEDAELRAVVVLVQGEHRIGLLVDEVLDVLAATPPMLHALPAMPSQSAHQHLRGMVTTGERHVLLLDPGAWLAAAPAHA